MKPFKMKRIYKIIILFAAIFIIGVLAMVVFISYSIDKKEELRAAASSQPAEKPISSVLYW